MNTNSTELYINNYTPVTYSQSSGLSLNFIRPLLPATRHFININVPVFSTLALFNNIAILVLLIGPEFLRVHLKGPPSVQFYYEFIACADLTSLIMPFYYLLGELKGQRYFLENYN